MKKIGIIIGSLKKESINRQLAQALIKLSHPDIDFSFIDISKLPFYSEDLEASLPLPASVIEFRRAVDAMDGILFVTPEYNRSIPGVLKNAIDWGSRPYGQGCLKGKEAAIMGASVSGAGTAVAQSHLRSILPILGMKLIRQPEMYITIKDGMYTSDGAFADVATAEFFKKFLHVLAAE